MIYPNNFEQKIGIDAIRQFIIEKCLCPIGEEQVTAMNFSTDYATIAKWLEQTGEFARILRNKEEFPTDFFLDVRDSLQRVEKDVTVWFSEEEISALMNSLQTIINIAVFFHNMKTDTGKLKYPVLTSMADEIQVFPALVEKANAILDKSVQVKDNASRRLADIRKDKAEAVKAITRNMQVAMRDAQVAGLIGRDTQPSLRDGHMLIPVGAGNKRKIKGTVHGDSGSGKTVFIEPEAVAEASNRLRELESDERREVIKILIGFTDLVRPHIADLMRSYRFMGEIDFIRAKASFSIRINGVKPIFEDKQQIEWVQAIHPLLNIQLLQQRKQAYPLDIRLNGKDRLLVVSGANAGGKSLCLKTVALLQYMLQCGLLIPVHESSRIGIFEHIFVDIGDGQSIENSLSTYTSHLTNMKFIVENCNDKSLILIDEFGSGTEPQIGGAIAETLLDRFNRNHSFGVITTHFQNLKHFAYETDGIINGAMLYDTENMQPLYRLSIGNPGSSFAIEVARRIGLPEDIIIDSSAKIGEDFINIDNFLQSIARDKLFWEDKRKEAAENTSKAIEVTELNEEKANKPLKKQSVKSPVIETGDSVRLNGQTAIGVVLEIQGKRVTVAFGSIKSTVVLEQLNLVSKKTM
ncbi:MutS2/Smr-associated SH3 domain-containing protein [uncultured Bacteroides sp.]|uniref:endonuclease MutS2 n=1 Tax=uncultured Bacteroides sp. TaxID=162156 RepID=UPI0025DA6466|nr:MutS2/Smr-associated SH3 domain-containing protein [uncultured Bacteroides sp.]